MQTQSVDVVILGSGAVGQRAAYASRERDKSVVVIETREPGGTCPNRGCDAKKPYVQAAQTLRLAQAMAGKGLKLDGGIDWPALVNFKRSFTAPVGEQTTQDLEAAGAQVVIAEPRFVDERTIEADGVWYTAKRIVIATGHEPVQLDIPGQEHAIDSDGFLELDELPKRVAFIGGGYISMEFAGVAAAAGSEVTVIESATYPLGHFDPDAVRTLLSAMNHQGIDVVTQRKVTGIDKTPDGLSVVTQNNQPRIVADLVVGAVGRRPSVGKLDLSAGGVEHGPAGIRVDRHLRSTSNPRVFSGGDVADQGRPPLTPTASQDATVLSANLWADERDMREQITAPVASVAFTCPPVATVGMQESAAREAFGEVTVVAGDMSSWKLLREHGHAHGYYKLIFRPDDGPLVGVHLVGYGVDEAINLFSLAICQCSSLDDLCKIALAYPTLSFNLHNLLRKHRG